MTITDNGDDFERAVQSRFAELRAAGQMPVLQRGGRGRGYTVPGGGGETLWSRMGIGGSRRAA